MTSSGRNQCQPVGHVELHGVQRAHSVLVERARQQFAILGESRVFHIPRVVRQIFRLLLLPDQKWLCFQIQTCHP